MITASGSALGPAPKERRHRRRPLNSTGPNVRAISDQGIRRFFVASQVLGLGSAFAKLR